VIALRGRHIGGFGLLATILMVGAGGCCAPKPPRISSLAPNAGFVAIADMQPPTIVASMATIIAQHNERIGDLARLRTPVTMIIDAPDPRHDEPERRRRDQVEGNLQVIQPASVSLRVDKLSQTLFVLGSNEEHYWWIEFGDVRRAFVGRIAEASMEKAAMFGLPVHPLDLLELAAITPLSEAARGGWDPTRTAGQIGDGSDPSAGVHRVRDNLMHGSAQASNVGRAGGVRELLFDPVSGEARAVWLLSSKGRAVAWSELTRYAAVPVDGNAFSSAAIATRINVTIPTQDGRDQTRVEISLGKPENPGSRLRTKQFVLEEVLSAYSVEEIIDIDTLSTGDGSAPVTTPKLQSIPRMLDPND